MNNRPPHIVIVEDVESNFLYLNAVLNKIKAKIFWAKNGKEAVDICLDGNEPIDLVLMDLQMPEMNGYEAAQEIKKIKPDLPVIAQTAFAMSDDPRQGVGSRLRRLSGQTHKIERFAGYGPKIFVTSLPEEIL
jgi:CheY-like chemotaxis protein